jgi:phytanoyl-CoA hydroxylase
MLSTTQREQYERDGCVLVSGIFTGAELDELEQALDALIDLRLKREAGLDATWGGDWKDEMPPTQILHTHDVQAYSAAWSRAIVHDRLTAAMADLIGPNVQLHHTKAFIKPPEKGSAFPMHQDYPYFPHAKHSMAAGIIHLSDATEDMGCVCFYPGSHKLGPLPTVRERLLYLDPKQYPIDKATPCVARRGDVAFFSYLTIHGSGTNRSPRTRKTVLIQFRDPADTPTADFHRSHAQGLMLRGIDPLEGRDTAGGTLEENQHRH